MKSRAYKRSPLYIASKMNKILKSLCLSLVVTLAANASASAFSNIVKKVADSFPSGQESITVGAAGTLEIAFSPKEGAEALVIKTINSAQSEIHMLAYSFTSAPVVEALIAARKRGKNGVAITLVADYKHNVLEDKSGKARAALSALANAGVDVRVISSYAIHHDKVIIADRKHVQLGSFNYSDAAETKNSENVLVNWNNPALAQAYLGHFQRNYTKSRKFELNY